MSFYALIEITTTQTLNGSAWIFNVSRLIKESRKGFFFYCAKNGSQCTREQNRAREHAYVSFNKHGHLRQLKKVWSFFCFRWNYCLQKRKSKICISETVRKELKCTPPAQKGRKRIFQERKAAPHHENLVYQLVHSNSPSDRAMNTNMENISDRKLSSELLDNPINPLLFHINSSIYNLTKSSSIQRGRYKNERIVSPFFLPLPLYFAFIAVLSLFLARLHGLKAAWEFSEIQVKLISGTIFSPETISKGDDIKIKG